MKVEIFNLSHNNQHVWLRIPRDEDYTDWPLTGVILTLPRSVLTYGFAQGERILAEVDYDTLHNNGKYWIANVELIDVLTTRRDPDSTDMETPSGTGASRGLDT
jgi:hypothetical protein